MKISVIHPTYKKNIYVPETIALNLDALNNSGCDYQYIIFNDKGDESIYDDVKHFLKDNVTYIYSEINYGMGVCSGGWVGAIPYLEGEYIHNAGQDDVYTSEFYRSAISSLQNPKVYLTYSNGFSTNENLEFTNSLMGPYQNIDYSKPREVFNMWFQRRGDKLTAANNYIPAPGVVYKKQLHDLIGPPDLSFKGSADFEYWARILFNNIEISYEPKPLWFYRTSEYSLGNKPDAQKDVISWNNSILNKYQTWLTQLLREGQVL